MKYTPEQLMLAAGLNFESLATAAGVSSHCVRRLMYGQTRLLQADKLERIGKVLIERIKERKVGVELNLMDFVVLCTERRDAIQRRQRRRAG